LGVATARRAIGTGALWKCSVGTDLTGAARAFVASADRLAPMRSLGTAVAVLLGAGRVTRSPAPVPLCALKLIRTGFRLGPASSR
jgi:hypothetical protein